MVTSLDCSLITKQLDIVLEDMGVVDECNVVEKVKIRDFSAI